MPVQAVVNAAIGWALAALGIVAGWFGYGWPGVLMALSVTVFWLLLQFSRVMRVMRDAAARPVGVIDNAVMLHARLRPGMKLLQVLPLTRSLGQKIADDPETFVWTDGAGDRVRVELRAGRCASFVLERAPVADPPAGAGAAKP
jgi:hypothetical protein